MVIKIVKSLKKTFPNQKKTYFIADIAANHDGSLARAKKLIRLCAKAGADAAKFQHFKASTIVSNIGFSEIGKKSHQSKWKKSVYDTYRDASINFAWTKELYLECQKNKIDFMTSPYDLEYVDKVEKYISAYKIGSGDITWHKIIKKIAKKNKPVILATGSSNLEEVKKAIKLIDKFNKKIVLMQCNTNYSNSENNFNFLNLNVLKQYKNIFKKNVILGLSDHTPGHSSVLGAVSLGAKVIEKHFTDSNSRNGPDHKFSLNYHTWKLMVDETKRLERALGDGIKRVEKNEILTNRIQRRSYYAQQDIYKGQKISQKMIIPLRPFLINSFSPDQDVKILNKKAKKFIKSGKCIKKNLIK